MKPRSKDPAAVFKLTAEYVKPDSKGRVTLGASVTADSRFHVYRNARGQILLDPVTLPAREAWLWDNPAALASVKQGLAESAAGKAKPLSHYKPSRPDADQRIADLAREAKVAPIIASQKRSRAEALDALSDADRKAFDRLPSGWFGVRQVPFTVTRPRWRCDRLVSQGILESRVVGDIKDIASIETQYRKLPR